MTRRDPFAPIGDGDDAEVRPAKQKAWTIVMPVPPDAPPPLAKHFRLGKPTAIWTYRDSAGAVLGYALRFDGEDGEKQFRPLALWRPAKGGNAEWRWESWPPKRPLYGLQALAERPSAPVVICEGEKSADAAAGLLPASVAITSPNGSQSAHKADWLPLKGRRVVIWPDGDLAGAQYAEAVAEQVKTAGAISVAIVHPPDGFVVVAKPPEKNEREIDWTALRGRRVVIWPDGDGAYAAKIARKIGAVGAASVEIKSRPENGIESWDAADALAEGWGQVRARELIESAAAAAPHADSGSGRGRRRRTPQRDTLIEVTDGCELWHDADRVAYATFAVNSHHEHWPVRSREFRMWLSGRFFQETGGALGGQALEDGIRILEAQAVNEGAKYQPSIRVGRVGKTLYLDLCDAHWRAVEITASGWAVVENPAVKLLRSSSMRALPEPEAGGMIEELRGFLNVRSDDDFMLVVAWLVAALRDRGPYPVLAINGEQGAGKSVFSRMIRALVDPSAAPIRAVPKDDRDLVVSAGNSWALVFDNLSSVPAWFADALCRLATGSGFATRMLHTDRSETIFDAARPIVLNGIPSLTDRADLADRAVTIHLATITEEARDSEDDLIAAFEAKRPIILGALLDAVAGALRNLDKVRLERMPRMADLAKWITAAEPALGWESGRFLTVYRENRRDVIETSFEADAVAVAIRDFIIADRPDGWTGTATELLSALNVCVNEGIRKSKLWPLSAQGLGNRIDRIAPLLRNKGFVVERRHSGQRHIIIKPPATVDSASVGARS
ncbi:MAG: ATP-binding protein [Xanthobacteraceae bacterium]